MEWKIKNRVDENNKLNSDDLPSNIKQEVIEYNKINNKIEQINNIKNEIKNINKITNDKTMMK